MFLKQAEQHPAGTRIDVAQAWMPGRDSSLLDLLFNTLGGGAAATAVTAWQNVANLEA